MFSKHSSWGTMNVWKLSSTFQISQPIFINHSGLWLSNKLMFFCFVTGQHFSLATNVWRADVQWSMWNLVTYLWCHHNSCTSSSRKGTQSLWGRIFSQKATPIWFDLPLRMSHPFQRMTSSQVFLSCSPFCSTKLHSPQAVWWLETSVWCIGQSTASTMNRKCKWWD